MKNTVLIIAISFVSFFLHACGPGDPPPPPPDSEEVITMVQLSFRDSATGAVADTVVFNDPDGAGGLAPVRFDSVILDAGKVYLADFAVKNTSSGKAVDITPEVEKEKAEHIICYTPQGAQLLVLHTDTDGTYPVGLKSKWITGNAGRGKITVSLKHQPGSKNGTCDPGETDVEVEFPVRIK